MPTWDAQQYLRFNDERTRPCRELAARLSLASPNNIIDLGCGPGNSTAVLAERWPAAKITGLDSSPAMIKAARESAPDREWVTEDISAWTERSQGSFDLVFSNAALHWVPNHASILPNLMAHLAPGGALAVQMPGNIDSPAHALMRDISSEPAWRDVFTRPPRQWRVETMETYYDILAPHAATVDLWTTEYQQIMPDAAAIVEWYKGTGLRPFLDALPDDDKHAAFLAEYLARIRRAYPARPDGRVLFPFRRIFFIARAR